ncbi:SGNH/GDSL hydrolase family protein [Yoonia sp. SS1-5]|uniref:SGNH/GDSL hydrolase family protein n=1 Tax=Yoonia rhodophyticola TaxID=3137370 RepID=A0AAN0MAA9_9RHOB
MIDVPVRFALLPLLLAQAAYLRATVLQLPEPDGPRSGVVGQGAPLRLLIIGDSSAAGVGVAHQHDALLGQLTARLSEDAEITFDLVARTGARTGDVLAWLDDLPHRHYDVVVTALGVNDVTKAVPLRKWIARQRALIARLQGAFGVKHVMLSGLPPMGQFPLLPQPLRWILGRQAARFDAALCDIARETQGCTKIAIDLALGPHNMSADGFHPGPAVYAAWAAEIQTQLRARTTLLDGGQGNT